MAIEQRAHRYIPFDAMLMRVEPVAAALKSAAEGSRFSRPFRHGLTAEREHEVRAELSETVGLLNRWGEPWALAGSQALGVWDGKIRRDYKDLDIVTYEANYPSLYRYLLRSGYNHFVPNPETLPDRRDILMKGQQFFFKVRPEVSGVKNIDVFPLTRSEDGRHLKSNFMGIPLPEDMIEKALRYTTPSGEEFRVLAPSIVLVHKLLGARYAGREKDRKDARYYMKKISEEEMQKLITLRQESRQCIPKDWDWFA